MAIFYASASTLEAICPNARTDGQGGNAVENPI
jgi:hypothetical protein